ARRREPRDLAAEDAAELEQVADQLRLAAAERQEMLDQLDAAGLHEVLHARTVALADANEPEMLELLQRFSQRRAIDAKSLRQLALRRQLRARRILTVQDQRAQLLRDLLGNTLLLHGL